MIFQSLMENLFYSITCEQQIHWLRCLLFPLCFCGISLWSRGLFVLREVSSFEGTAIICTWAPERISSNVIKCSLESDSSLLKKRNSATFICLLGKMTTLFWQRSLKTLVWRWQLQFSAQGDVSFSSFSGVQFVFSSGASSS